MQVVMLKTMRLIFLRGCRYAFICRNCHRLPDIPRWVEVRDLLFAEDLREELLHVVAYSPLAALFIEDRPVSFCYAASQTESWWDVSIDTLAPHRRHGYADLCFAYLARHMQTLGKAVVWQSLESNPASWQLALKLGLKLIDELACFRRAGTALNLSV
ncbi:MAG: GNAT family N-acetyltransferase [Anaerolineae bacterium]|nr:GNAT family N-acetyltransferase [Anaerolineae bacterium]